MKRRAHDQGADTKKLGELQKLAVEKVISGLDFNPVSLQMAAAQLIAGNHSISYRKMGLHRMEYGPKDDGTVGVGSLELLGHSEILPRLGEWNHGYEDLNKFKSERVQLSHEDDPMLEDAVKAVKDVRLIVMNPPFTNREKMGEKFPMEVRKRMRASVDNLDSTLKTYDLEMDGFADKNSIEPLFVALADRCLNKKRGILTMINPTIVMTATAALKKRKLLAKRFQIHTILTSHEPGQVNLSQNTGISESIIIACRAVGERYPTRIINLDRMPLDESEVDNLHQSLLNCKRGLIPNGWGEVSDWPTHRIAEGDWSAVIWRSPRLATNASRIANMQNLISLNNQSMIPAATGQILRGSFKVSTPETPCSFPILKSKGEQAQMKIKATPDEYWIPKKSGEKDLFSSEHEHSETTKMLQKAGYLLITAGQGVSSARLTAVASDEKYVGNGWMPIPNITPEKAKAVAVFLNSTAGRLQIMRSPGKSLQFPVYSTRETSNIRVPDLSDNQIVEILADCWERTADIEVPQFRDGECEVRRIWDEAVSTALQWNIDALQELRHLLHKEPFVRGYGYNQYGD